MTEQHFQQEEGGNGSHSAIKLKREEFRKEIRSDRLSQDFAARRKMLFREQMAQKINSYSNQFTQLNSWQQVREQLTTAFMPNYQGLNKFIEENHREGIPSDVEEMLIKTVQKADFLTQEHALVLLVTLTNVQKDGKVMFDSGTIKLLVDNLIKWNVVKEEEQQKYEGKVHYFDTVCWVLLSLVMICAQNFQQTFSTLRENMAVFQTHKSTISYQQMALFAQLSTHPSFLPSLQFIKHILQLSSSAYRPQAKILQIEVYLLDNFMRQKQQNAHRFQLEENLELTVMYLEFILDRLEDMAFARRQKNLLVALLTALVKSAEDNVLEGMFRTQKTQKLALLMFKKAEFDEWTGKKLSLICVMQMLCKSILLPILNRIYNPHNIAYLLYNSLLLPDTEIQQGVITAMFSLCVMQPNIYLKEFRKYNLSGVMMELHHKVKDENEDLLGQLALLQNHIDTWEQNMRNNVWMSQQTGQGDVEI